MTDIATRDEQPATEVAQRTSSTVARLAEWADEARAAFQLASTLCKTNFVPAHFRGKPEETMAAILTGHEMGMSPMAATRAIYVIQGTPAMYAKAMQAVLLSHGHKIWVVEASPTKVVVRGHRKDDPDHPSESVWTIDRARIAELLSNAHYKKNPQNMLTARATAEVCRLVAPDALFGIPYAVEELDDREPIRVEATTPRVTAAEILGTAPQPAAVEAGPAGDDLPVEDPPYADEWPDAAPIPGSQQ